MKFKVNDEVKVVKVNKGAGIDKRNSLGYIGAITRLDDDDKPYRVDFKELNDWWWFAENELELAVKTVEFKVGDEVKVIDSEGDDRATIGDIATVIHVEPAADPKDGQLIRIKTTEGTVYAMFACRFAKVASSTMTYRDALLHTINGTMTVRHTSMTQGEYLVFDGKWKDNTGALRGIISIDENKGNWEQYIALPKFTINSLVYNADGTIGKVVEDKGLYKGVRKYAVKFNAVRKTLKNMDETELSAYGQI